MPRLFVTVWPPADVVGELTSLPRKDQRGVRFVPPENWHITLRFLGEADVDDVATALDAAVFEPATVGLGPAVDVLAGRALIVPASGLERLAASVTACTRTIGERPRPRFVGHLTLARLSPKARLPAAIGARFDAGFDVDEVALVESRLHPDGARYETLQTWPVPPGGSG